MKISLATKEQIKLLVEISKAAFGTDVTVGAKEAGGPPDYDSENWHKEMQSSKHLYALLQEDEVIGGAVLFVEQKEKPAMYIGRIFINPVYHRKGYGIKAMEQIEKLNSDITTFQLETPVWNRRTNCFYKKIGYKEMHRDKESVYYQKDIK